MQIAQVRRTQSSVRPSVRHVDFIVPPPSLLLLLLLAPSSSRSNLSVINSLHPCRLLLFRRTGLACLPTILHSQFTQSSCMRADAASISLDSPNLIASHSSHHLSSFPYFSTSQYPGGTLDLFRFSVAIIAVISVRPALPFSVRHVVVFCQLFQLAFSVFNVVGEM